MVTVAICHKDHIAPIPLIAGEVFAVVLFFVWQLFWADASEEEA